MAFIPLIEKRIVKEFNLHASNEVPFDLVYLDKIEENIVSDYSDKIHNDSMIFLENIHRTKKQTQSWEVLKQSEMVSVSIDLFHCGLLFFRKEQVKEHFKIRI